MSEQHPITDSLLDRLVDGELPELERRQILHSLDSQPGEWRRCALAFLEAQTWKQALGDALVKSEQSSSLAAERATLIAPAESLSLKQSLSWRTYLAIAASFLLTFSLSMFFTRTTSSPSLPSLNDLATTTSSTVVANPGIIKDNATELKAAPAALRLTLASQGNEPQSIDVPITDDAQQIESLFAQNPNVLSPHLRQQLERAGNQIQQQRQLLPIQLNDGRQIVVPVDRVDVHYVGNRSVQ